MFIFCLARIGWACAWDLAKLPDIQQKRTNYSDRTGVEELAGNELLTSIRVKIADNFKQALPSPHSELLSGMVLGYDELYLEPAFKENLKRAGLVHVVVVSGFNISLVFTLAFKFLGSKYKTRNLLYGLLLCTAYALLCGFEPPVFRALIMGSTASIATFYGRRINAFKILLFSVMVMILVDPFVLFSISFQLSLAATCGLVFFGNIMQEKVGQTGLKGFIKDDLATTLSAQIFVAPLLLYYFKILSLISVVVNALILWTVPLITVMGFVFVPLSFMPKSYLVPFVIVMYPYLDVFVRATDLFARIPLTLTVDEVTPWQLAVVYSGVVLMGWRVRRPKVHKLAT